jgi:uncharacterized phage protein (TIGR01671 family)
MKQYKFRAWDKEKNRMYLDGGSSIYFSLKESIDGGIIYSEKYIFMQFTGIYDKNGKEIYENDILKYTWKKCECGREESGNFIVKFNSMGVRILGELINDPSLTEKDVEVIGNIYENEGLLND